MVDIEQLVDFGYWNAMSMNASIFDREGKVGIFTSRLNALICAARKRAFYEGDDSEGLMPTALIVPPSSGAIDMDVFKKNSLKVIQTPILLEEKFYSLIAPEKRYLGFALFKEISPSFVQEMVLSKLLDTPYRNIYAFCY